MSLLLPLLLLFELALALGLAWTLWYARRRLDEMQRRVDESLDDQDLLEFESKVRSLLQEVKDSAGTMIEAIERREEALLRGLEKVKDAEKRLYAKGQALEAAAEKAERRLSSAASGKLLKGQSRAKRSSTRAEAPPAASAEGPSAVEPEKTLEIKPSYAQRPFPSQPLPGAPSPAAPSKFQRLYELADKGASREEICRATGMLPGEVELVLNLRPAARRRPK